MPKPSTPARFGFGDQPADLSRLALDVVNLGYEISLISSGLGYDLRKEGVRVRVVGEGDWIRWQLWIRDKWAVYRLCESGYVDNNMWAPCELNLIRNAKPEELDPRRALRPVPQGFTDQIYQVHQSGSVQRVSRLDSARVMKVTGVIGRKAKCDPSDPSAEPWFTISVIVGNDIVHILFDGKDKWHYLSQSHIITHNPKKKFVLNQQDRELLIEAVKSFSHQITR